MVKKKVTAHDRILDFFSVPRCDEMFTSKQISKELNLALLVTETTLRDIAMEGLLPVGMKKDGSGFFVVNIWRLPPNQEQ